MPRCKHVVFCSLFLFLGCVFVKASNPWPVAIQALEEKDRLEQPQERDPCAAAFDNAADVPDQSASSTQPTDFNATVPDQPPDGFASNLTDEEKNQILLDSVARANFHMPENSIAAS